MGGSPGDVSEEPVTLEKRNKGWRMSCDVGKATESLENGLYSFKCTIKPQNLIKIVEIHID